MSNQIIGRDLYFRRVYGGKPGPVLHARVWDAERFMAAQREQGERERNEEDRFVPEPATEQEFHFEKRKT